MVEIIGIYSTIKAGFEVAYSTFGTMIGLEQIFGILMGLIAGNQLSNQSDLGL